MKKQIGWMMTALFALAITATSCKKDTNDNPTPAPAPAPTKTQLLTAKNWKMQAMVSNGMNIYPMLPACEKDNFMTFKADFSYTSNEGATKCMPTDPQTENGSWKFINNEGAMVVDNEDTMVLRKFTADTLRFETYFEDDNGGRGTALVTMIPAQ